MADYSFGGAEVEDPELRRLNAEVASNPDEFENWEKLVHAAETLEGGLNRNSSPQSIAAARDVYDRFLAKFPLFFGYWKKYADLEFAIGGTEAAEMVYERGVGSIGNSVDLWVNYCTFRVETCHDTDLVRELCERAVDSAGLDFLAHPLWDRYLEFEERLEQHDRIFAIISRVIHIPLHQYARYFERYRQLAASRPITELAPQDVLARLQSDASQETGLKGGGAAELERELRAKLDQYHLEIFHQTQTATTKRWAYEQEIKRPYFHVTELDESQPANWHRYLDFEESEGDFERTQFLYERCVVIAAHYDEFWQRYARWMYAQGDKDEEVRNIFLRASCLYTPIARPAIRMQWALFEESSGRISVAAAIYEAVLVVMPDHLNAIVCLANLRRRQDGYDAAITVYEQYLAGAECSVSTKGALVSEMAKLAWQTKGSADEARVIFQTHQQSLLDSEPFWAGLLDFEATQPTPQGTEAAQYARVKAAHVDIRAKSRLSPDAIKDLSQAYMRYLTQRGGKSAAKEYLDLDAEVNGPVSIVPIMRSKGALNGKVGLSNGGA